MQKTQLSINSLDFISLPTAEPAMPRKRQRKPVHYTAIAYQDGAVIAAFPMVKPTAKHLKERKQVVDADGVCIESKYAWQGFGTFPDAERRHLATLHANRLNTRRALREIVLQELTSIQAAVARLSEQIEQLDRRLAQLAAQKPSP
jgi:hypothetical protein